MGTFFKKNYIYRTNILCNLNYQVSCEMASTILLSTAKRSQKIKLAQFRTNPDAEGIAIMSLDVLDFSIVRIKKKVFITLTLCISNFCRFIYQHTKDYSENTEKNCI